MITQIIEIDGLSPGGLLRNPAYPGAAATAAQALRIANLTTAAGEFGRRGAGWSLTAEVDARCAIAADRAPGGRSPSAIPFFMRPVERSVEAAAKSLHAGALRCSPDSSAPNESAGFLAPAPFLPASSPCLASPRLFRGNVGFPTAAVKAIPLKGTVQCRVTALGIIAPIGAPVARFVSAMPAELQANHAKAS